MLSFLQLLLSPPPLMLLLQLLWPEMMMAPTRAADFLPAAPPPQRREQKQIWTFAHYCTLLVSSTFLLLRKSKRRAGQRCDVAGTITLQRWPASPTAASARHRCLYAGQRCRCAALNVWPNCSLREQFGLVLLSTRDETPAGHDDGCEHRSQVVLNFVHTRANLND